MTPFEQGVAARQKANGKKPYEQWRYRYGGDGLSFYEWCMLCPYGKMTVDYSEFMQGWNSSSDTEIAHD